MRKTLRMRMRIRKKRGTRRVARRYGGNSKVRSNISDASSTASSSSNQEQGQGQGQAQVQGQGQENAITNPIKPVKKRPCNPPNTPRDVDGHCCYDGISRNNKCKRTKDRRKQKEEAKAKAALDNALNNGQAPVGSQRQSKSLSQGKVGNIGNILNHPSNAIHPTNVMNPIVEPNGHAYDFPMLQNMNTNTMPKPMKIPKEIVCQADEELHPNGKKCIKKCKEGEKRNEQGRCVIDRKCADDEELNKRKKCIKKCPEGVQRNKYGKCQKEKKGDDDEYDEDEDEDDGDEDIEDLVDNNGITTSMDKDNDRAEHDMDIYKYNEQNFGKLDETFQTIDDLLGTISSDLAANEFIRRFGKNAKPIHYEEFDPAIHDEKDKDKYVVLTDPFRDTNKDWSTVKADVYNPDLKRQSEMNRRKDEYKRFFRNLPDKYIHFMYESYFGQEPPSKQNIEINQAIDERSFEKNAIVRYSPNANKQVDKDIYPLIEQLCAAVSKKKHTAKNSPPKKGNVNANTNKENALINRMVNVQATNAQATKAQATNVQATNVQATNTQGQPKPTATNDLPVPVTNPPLIVKKKIAPTFVRPLDQQKETGEKVIKL